jgi:hypothetical protein
MPSFFILDWSVVRFMTRRAAAPPEGPPITPWASRSAPRNRRVVEIYLFQVLGEVFKQLNANYREKE